MSTLAIIPARGGSKGLLRKNLQCVGGKPLVVRAIEQARAARHLDDIVVSTDDAEIAAVSEQAGAEVLWRPAALATDRVPTLAVLQHVLHTRDFRELPAKIVTLQPTSPLRCAWQIDDATGLLTSDFDAVVSVCQASHSPYKMFSIVGDALRPLIDGSLAPGVARQDLPIAYQENGAVYVTWTRVILEQHSIWGNRTKPFVMDRESSVDIDTAFDLILAETILSTRQYSEVNDGRDSTD